MWAAMAIWHRPKSANIFSTGSKGPACSSQRNHPRLKAVALVLEKTADGSNQRNHPRLKAVALVLEKTADGSNQRNHPRLKAVALALEKTPDGSKQRNHPRLKAGPSPRHGAIIVPTSIAEYRGEGRSPNFSLFLNLRGAVLRALRKGAMLTLGEKRDTTCISTPRAATELNRNHF